MANYCSNLLSINTNDAATLDRLIAIASPKPQTTFSRWLGWVKGTAVEPHVGLLEFFMPMPQQVKSSITNGYSGSTPAWQKWQVENWGCAFDIPVDRVNRTKPDEVVFQFTSRYSPPVGAAQHGARLHNFQFRLIYCETGNQFAGIATEQEHTEFDFSFNVHPREEGVPEELVNQFNLTEIYEEVIADKLENP